MALAMEPGWRYRVLFPDTTPIAAMYLPSAFREDSLEVQHDFIRAHPLGVMMTSGEGGLCLLYTSDAADE